MTAGDADTEGDLDTSLDAGTDMDSNTEGAGKERKLIPRCKLISSYLEIYFRMFDIVRNIG